MQVSGFSFLLTPFTFRLRLAACRGNLDERITHVVPPTEGIVTDRQKDLVSFVTSGYTNFSQECLSENFDTAEIFVVKDRDYCLDWSFTFDSSRSKHIFPRLVAILSLPLMKEFNRGVTLSKETVKKNLGTHRQCGLIDGRLTGPIYIYFRSVILGWSPLMSGKGWDGDRLIWGFLSV